MQPGPADDERVMPVLSATPVLRWKDQVCHVSWVVGATDRGRVPVLGQPARRLEPHVILSVWQRSVSLLLLAGHLQKSKSFIRYGSMIHFDLVSEAICMDLPFVRLVLL